MFFKSKEEKEEKKFKTKEEKEAKKAEKQYKNEKTVSFMGENLQPIGKIPARVGVGIFCHPESEKINIHHDKIDISLPYNRLIGFSLQSESVAMSSGSPVLKTLIGGALFGNVGAVAGAAASKNKVKQHWIGTLSYCDKNGEIQQLAFIQSGLMGFYTDNQKHFAAGQFEDTINRIASRYAEDINEL